MNEVIVTAARSMQSYGSRVVDNLLKFPSFRELGEALNGVGIIRTDRFADGEMEVSLGASVRGKDAIVFTSAARNEAGLAVEEAKIELYHTVDALKRAQAARIIVFEPFISCSRSDRTTRRNSVGLWVHFKTLTALGANHIITYQLHSNKSQAMLDPSVCTLDDIPALTLLERYLCNAYIHDMDFLENEVRPNWAFCSVDAGGEKLARSFANDFGSHLVVAHKQRDYSKSNSIASINILSAEPVEGKVLWIVDDMVDTGGSVESLVRALAPHKPREVNIIAVHALFSPPAEEHLRKLSEEGLLNRVIVTDTVCCAESMNGGVALEVVPSAELSAKIIRAVLTNQSMGKLLRPFNAELYLKSPNLFNQM